MLSGRDGREGRPGQRLGKAFAHLGPVAIKLGQVLATRADIEDLLRGSPEARLEVGWRAELVGGPIRSLVSGDAALAFEGDGNLVLERRSRQPLR